MPWDSASGVKLEPACGVFDSRVKRIPFSNFDRSPYGPSGRPSSLADPLVGASKPPPNAAPNCNTRLRFIGTPRGSFYAARRFGTGIFRASLSGLFRHSIAMVNYDRAKRPAL